ncbi:hypothetical protein CAEBREN_23101 [Caenorhabditis brenneri]|uniref:Uncharacterized protein n=1 Tax=Caenorhabditis brenneri TaxID=135651 RepID=G0MWS4_CAEBE|nr:hypothetical protein CAEBREN_23101 [Caenorhabditis brenneri]
MFCTETVLLFAATVFFSTFYTLIRDSAKEFEWDNKTIQYFEGVQGFLAVCQFFFLHVSVIYECDKRNNMYIMNQIFLSVLWAFSSFYLCAILMRKLKLKESVERPDETENPVVGEDPVLPAEDAIQGD